jgi:hypothetical protein
MDHKLQVNEGTVYILRWSLQKGETICQFV